MECNFTFAHLEHIFDTAISEGYCLITLKDYFLGNYDTHKKNMIIRVDVDIDCFRVRRIVEYLNKRKMRATFFFRLHAKYNIFSFEIFNIIQELIKDSHELGIHTELVDMQAICKRDPGELLAHEIKTFESLFKTKIFGTAAHGDFTGFNNLEFWKQFKASDFGLVYEAYDPALFDNCLYVSDSQITSWKAYNNGKLITGDNRCACQHVKGGSRLVTLLIHPCTYYDKHFHEGV